MVQSRTENSKINIELALIFLYFGWLIGNIFFGERIPVNDGRGWDGVIFANIAQHFSDLVFHHEVDQYELQRIIPSGIVYLFFVKVCGLSLTSAQMPTVFSIYNIAILLFAVFVWSKIAKQLAWNPQVRLISFTGLFLNYANLKMITYYPILTDQSAFACGLLMIYFFLNNKNFNVLLTAVIGAFIFPTLLYVGTILFIFPLNKSKHSNRISQFIVDKAIIFAIFLGAMVTLLGIYLCVVLKEHTISCDYSAFVLAISSVTLFTYLTLAMYPILKMTHMNLRIIKCIPRKAINIFNDAFDAFALRILLAIVLIICLKKSIFLLSNGDVGSLPLQNFIQNIIAQSLAFPLNFFMSHVMYYGPIICLLTYFWKDVVGYLSDQGLGLFIVTSLYVVLSIGSESRQFINFLPIAVIAISQVLNQKKIGDMHTYVFISLSLAISKVWLPLNHGVWNDLLLTTQPQLSQEFPMQWYFMNFGPWVAPKIYIVNLLLISMMFFLINRYSKKLSSESST